VLTSGGEPTAIEKLVSYNVLNGFDQPFGRIIHQSTGGIFDVAYDQTTKIYTLEYDIQTPIGNIVGFYEGPIEML